MLNWNNMLVLKSMWGKATRLIVSEDLLPRCLQRETGLKPPPEVLARQFFIRADAYWPLVASSSADIGDMSIKLLPAGIKNILLKEDAASSLQLCRGVTFPASMIEDILYLKS